MQIVEAFLTQNPCYTANVERSDSRYRKFQDEGPKGLMLHSVGCAQPDASVFIKNWNKSTYTRACVHAFIDANSGDIFQTLPWNYRGWHGGGSCNNTHIGIEMCESGYIKYPDKGDLDFTILNRARAVEDCTRTYHAAVELFAMLCKQYNLDPMTDICSHREGGVKGIATKHADPEHYWTRLGMPYTMDTFRSAVKRKMEEMDMPTAEELEEIVTRILDDKFHTMWQSEYKKEIAKLNDNDSGKWSKKAREWAVDTGIVAGVGKLSDGNVNYAWEQPLTREQYVTMEYRQALGGGNKYD